MRISRSFTPIAAALALALACGSATAADASALRQSDAQKTDMSQSAMTSTDKTSAQEMNNDDMKQNKMASKDMTQEAKNAYREGQIWATYVVNPVLQSYTIDADVSDHKATLHGTVSTRFEKWLAEDLAQATDGIDTVDNELVIKPDVVLVTTVVPANAFARHVRDATTSARVNSMLLWNEYTDGLDIKVKTQDGKVTLTGMADTEKAKQRATRIASGTLGVASVNNQLTVNTASSNAHANSLDDDTIANRIKASYLYAFHVDAVNLDVEVNDGKVSLSGDADSDIGRQRAIDIAQHTSGVKSVDADAVQVMDASTQATASQ